MNLRKEFFTPVIAVAPSVCWHHYLGVSPEYKTWCNIREQFCNSEIIIHCYICIIDKTHYSGSEASAKIDCPYLFLGVYGYTHTDENGIVTCNTVNSSWDMCADNAVMMFDYTKCSTKVAYSGK